MSTWGMEINIHQLLHYPWHKMAVALYTVDVTSYGVINISLATVTASNLRFPNRKTIYFSEATWIENKYQSLTIFLSTVWSLTE